MKHDDDAEGQSPKPMTQSRDGLKPTALGLCVIHECEREPDQHP